MCRLAGRIADGVQLFLKTPDGVRQALRDVAVGAREAGRDPAGLDVVIRLPLVVDEAPDVVRFMGRRLLTGYATVPAYNASLARQGYEDEASAMAEAWTAGDRGRAVDLFPDALFDQLFLSGDAEACRARIEMFREAGVTTPVVMPLSFAGTREERAERVAAAVVSMAPR
jgi:alkanesulfonate monooxygenase SsuD/methylene tetrahydromethanopterin reductase-like flavin-dependent oxidoreductase (luciferase family)